MQETVPPTIAPAELKRRMEEPEPPVILDVRGPEEVAAWPMPGARHVPLPLLLRDPAAHAPRGAEVVTVCAHGVRSARAAGALRSIGVPARSLAGGMVAWNSVYDVADVPSKGAVTALQLRRVGKGCLGYLVASDGAAVAVDATRDVEAWLDAASERGWRIVAVADTHAHADHVSGGRALAQEAGCDYWAPAEARPARVVENGTELRVGQASLRAVATPGHTPGSVTYLVSDLAFTGDTLFVESVGRPDLGQDSRANAAVLWETLRERLLKLPGATRVLPGHVGGGVPVAPRAAVTATLDELRARLPALGLERDAFVEWVASTSGEKPANFGLIKRINVAELAEPARDEIAELEAGPNRCAV